MHTIRSGQQISIIRVLTHALLVMLAIYLVVGGGILGGWTAGLIYFPVYRINVSIIIFGGLAWLAWRFWRRRAFPTTPLDLPILAWLLALLLSSLASLDTRLSLETFVFYLVLVLLFYLMVDLQRTNNALESWRGYILLASTIIIALGYQELGNWYRDWLSIGAVGQPIPPATIRVSSILLAHPNLLAAYLNLLWPLAVGRLLVSPSPLVKAFLAFWCVAVLGLIYFTSSRGGWLGTAAASGMLILLLSLDRRELVQRMLQWLKAHRLFSFGILLTLVVLVGVAGVLLLHQSQNPTHPSGNPRGYIWSVAWEMFRQQPLLGTGLGTYVRAFLQTYSIPPGVILMHAHNFLLHLLGETGLLGAGAGLWIGLTLLWVAIRRWRSEPPGKRTLLAGSLAALAGLAVHSLFEVPQVVPLVNIITAALLAQLVAPYSVHGRMRQAVGLALLLAGWLTAAVLALYSLWGANAFQLGVEAASEGDLVTSSAWMDEAVRRDASLAFYHFQSGQAHTRLAVDAQMQVRDTKELGIALAQTQLGLQIDPSSSLDWVILGELRWLSGDRPGGIAALEHSVLLAPESPDLHLLLGTKYEESGQMERALEQYLKSLELHPEFAKTPFFQQTPTRQQALALFSPPQPDAGWLALQAGDFTEAEAYYRSQLGLNNDDAYLGLGLSLLGQGKLVEAEQALRTAEFIDNENLAVAQALVRLYESTGQVELENSARVKAAELSVPDAVQKRYCILQHNCFTSLDWALSGVFPWSTSAFSSP